jgi:murein DD-endopeptidase MepM/ murein hydrolase activator NlpD
MNEKSIYPELLLKEIDFDFIKLDGESLQGFNVADLKQKFPSMFQTQKIEGTKIEEDNGGITIQTVSGSAVKAVFEGVVTTVYDVAGSQTVTIKHGKYFTTYFNMSSVNVSKGSKVSMGEVIGRAGENFDGEGEIVFMVNEELRFVNPELWLKRK